MLVPESFRKMKKGPSKKSIEKPKSGDALYESAVKSLARRARSSNEIRLLLAKKKASKKDIESVLKRLQDNGYLDDARFARAFASSRLQNDLHGQARVRRDLAARRVRPDLIQAALDAVYEGVEEGELLRQYLRRKVRHSRLPDKPSAVANLYRRLLRAGFRSATIVRELQKMLPGRLSKGSHAESASWEELLESLAEPSEWESEPRLS